MKATRHGARALCHRRHRQAALRVVSRTSGPRRLHRHLRARPPDRRRKRHARRRARPRARAATRRSAAIPAATSSRPTTGKTGSARRTSARPGSTSPGTPSETEPGRHPRIRRLGREGRHRDDAGRQPRLARARRGAQLRRIRQPSRAAATGPTCARRTAARTPGTSSSGASATRWTAPGRSATRPPPNTATSPTRPPRRCAPSTTTLELVVCGSSAFRHADLSAVGSDGARGDLRQCRLHLAAHVFRELREEHGRTSWPCRKSSTATSARSSASSTIVKAKKRSKKDVTISLRRVERLVPRAQAGR